MARDRPKEDLKRGRVFVVDATNGSVQHKAARQDGVTSGRGGPAQGAARMAATVAGKSSLVPKEN